MRQFFCLMLLLTCVSAHAQSMCAPSTSDLIFADAFEPMTLSHRHGDPELDANATEHAAEPVAARATGGLWSDAATWGGQVPGVSSDVMIPTGATITLDINASVRSITVCGLLDVARRDTLLSTQWLMVMQRGELRVGSATQPFSQRFELTLGPADPSASVMGMGTKVLGAMSGGKIRMYGEPRVTWTRLNGSVGVGASTLRLAAPVDWRLSEEIVIASSAMNPDQAETRTIAAVSADRLEVTLTQPLSFAHFGEMQRFDGRDLDARAEVALKSRRLVIQGDASSGSNAFGGHVMIMGSGSGARESNPNLRSSARIIGVEFRRMGQFNRLGRYPIHWHFNDSSAGDVLSHSSFHSNYQRGIVIHGSDDVLIADNVIADSIGHGYVVEDGSERRNRFERNLGLNTRAATFTATGLSSQNDQLAATYWLRTAAVTMLGNVAAGGDHAGFWFDMGFIDGNNATKALLNFDRNTVHSYRTGGDTWAVWHTDGYVPSQDGLLRFTRLTAYKNQKGIETAGRGVTENSILADNGKGISNHLLRDSTLVSRSMNLDTDPAWGETGMFAYGGFANAENVGFVGFNNNRAISRTLACGIEYPRFAIRGARMLASDPAAGCGDVLMSDLDGSLTGASSARRVVAVEGRPNWPTAGSNDYGMLTSACQVFLPGRPDGHAVCPNYDYRALTVVYPTGAGFANPDWRIEIARATDNIRQTPGHFRWAAYVIPGWQYRLEVRNQRNLADPTVYPLNSLASVELSLSEGDFAEPTLLDGARNFAFDPEASARSTTIDAAAPASGFRIRACLRSMVCGSDPSQWPIQAPESTLAALNQSNRSGYFVDPAAGRIYFKLLGRETLRYER